MALLKPVATVPSMSVLVHSLVQNSTSVRQLILRWSTAALAVQQSGNYEHKHCAAWFTDVWDGSTLCANVSKNALAWRTRVPFEILVGCSATFVGRKNIETSMIVCKKCSSGHRGSWSWVHRIRLKNGVQIALSFIFNEWVLCTACFMHW